MPIVSATATGEHERGDARQRRHRLPAGLLRLASDERLVELLRGGSEAAFEALYARHHRGVLSFCRHMLGSREEAEDAVQHTFLAVYQDLLGSSKDVQLRPWLYAIARNRCLSALRARRERVDELLEPSTDHLSVEVEHRHELRALLGDLAELPDDQRAALVLAELGDLSHDEIGVALGCRREKVKALVFQARSSLIASRTARELPCEEVRQHLANLRGGSLRRNSLRRHVRACAGCREYQEQVRAQRRALALILPVVPSVGLKSAVLGSGAAVTSGSIAAKTLAVLAVAGGGVAAVETAREPSPAPDNGARAVRDRPLPAAPVAAAGAADAVPRAVEAWPAKAGGPEPRQATARGPRAGGEQRAKARGRGADGARAKARGRGADGERPAKARGRGADGERPAKARGRGADGERPAKARGPEAGRRPAKARGPAIVPPGQLEKAERGAAPGQVRRSEQAVPPGRADKAEPAAPPGKASPQDESVPPGHAVTVDDALPRGQAKKLDDGLPPGQAKTP